MHVNNQLLKTQVSFFNFLQLLSLWHAFYFLAQNDYREIASSCIMLWLIEIILNNMTVVQYNIFEIGQYSFETVVNLEVLLTLVLLSCV